MLVSSVHPVAILSAVFCIVCSLVVCLLDSVGDHVVLAYSRTGLVMALYVFISVSFCFPHDVDVSAFMAFIDEAAFCVVLVMCFEKLSLGSSVRPSIFGFGSVGRVSLSILKESFLLYSAGSGVNRVVIVLLAFSMRLLSDVHFTISSRYGWILCCAVS